MDRHPDSKLATSAALLIECFRQPLRGRHKILHKLIHNGPCRQWLVHQSHALTHVVSGELLGTCMTCFGTPETFRTCTRSCDTDAECGSPASTGATPDCAMLTTGDQGVCVLRCETDNQCPCGLSCVETSTPLFNICGEPGG